MKRFSLNSLFLLAFIYSLNAQTPWRAKIFFHFLDSSNNIITDTIWVGCDSLGNLGFDPDLDILDTQLHFNRVYSSDPIVKSTIGTDCANLNTDIRGFKKDSTYFTLYGFGKIRSISWDTSDYKYFDTVYRLNNIKLRCLNGYLLGIDNYEYLIGGDNYDIIGGHYVYKGFLFSPDSIMARSESQWNGCSITNNNLIVLQLIINMGVLHLGINEPKNMYEFDVYPCPFINEVFLDLNFKNREPYYYVSLKNLLGQTCYLNLVDASNRVKLDLTSLHSGYYFIEISDANHRRVSKNKKIIKL